MVLLREARRVARKSVVIKDHTLDGPLAGPTLRAMDWIGNSRYGVALPYNYWTKRRWLEAFKELGVEIALWTSTLRLYPWPASYLFDRSLHFVARLDASCFRASPNLSSEKTDLVTGTLHPGTPIPRARTA
jgi:hypothetical protein